MRSTPGPLKSDRTRTRSRPGPAGLPVGACGSGLDQANSSPGGRSARSSARRRRPGFDLEPEALAEAGEELELVEPGGDHRAAQPLAPALEVDHRAVALEVARAGDDDVRPGGEVALEHRGREDEACAAGELGDARVVGGLVARDDERADLALLGRVGAALAGLVPGSRHAAAVRRSRQDVDGDLGLPVLVQLVGERTRCGGRRWCRRPTRRARFASRRGGAWPSPSARSGCRPRAETRRPARPSRERPGRRPRR